MGNRWGNSGNSDWLYYLGAIKSLQMVIAAMKLKDTYYFKESYDKPRQHIQKQRHYFVKMICLVKAVVFPVVVYGCEIWTIKKAECQRIDAFELWWFRRLLRVPSSERKSNKSILKQISLVVHWKDWCWSWNSNTFATWCEVMTYLRRPWYWERLRAGGEGEDRVEMVGWHHWLNGHEFEPTPGGSQRTGKPGILQSMGCKELDMT